MSYLLLEGGVLLVVVVVVAVALVEEALELAELWVGVVGNGFQIGRPMPLVVASAGCDRLQVVVVGNG